MKVTLELNLPDKAVDSSGFVYDIFHHAFKQNLNYAESDDVTICKDGDETNVFIDCTDIRDLIASACDFTMGLSTVIGYITPLQENIHYSPKFELFYEFGIINAVARIDIVSFLSQYGNIGVGAGQLYKELTLLNCDMVELIVGNDDYAECLLKMITPMLEKMEYNYDKEIYDGIKLFKRDEEKYPNSKERSKCYRITITDNDNGSEIYNEPYYAFSAYQVYYLNKPNNSVIKYVIDRYIATQLDDTVSHTPYDFCPMEQSFSNIDKNYMEYSMTFKPDIATLLCDYVCDKSRSLDKFSSDKFKDFRFRVRIEEIR